jgi:integrase
LPTVPPDCYTGTMEDVAKSPYLEPRGSVWWFRRKIEKELLAYYAPKTEFRFSLRTKDKKEAEAKARIESVKLDQEFARVKAELLAEPKRTISDTEIARLEAIYYHQALEIDAEKREDGTGYEQAAKKIEEQLQALGVEYETWHPDDTEAEVGLSNRDYYKIQENIDICLPPAREWLAKGNTKPFEWEIDEFLASQGVELDKKSKEYRKASLGILRAWVRSMEATAQRNLGHIIETPAAPAPVVDHEQPSSCIRLSEAFNRWKREHKGPMKTPVEFEAQIKRFISLHDDLPIDQITKAHVRQFKDAMMQYPARPSNAVRKLPVLEVLEMYKDKPEVPRLQPQSINEKCLAALRAILTHAVSDGYIDTNVALGISVKEDSNAEPPVLPYSDEEIATILKFPIFAEGERPAAGGGAASVWLPLVSMYSGARLEEMAQLTRENIGTEEGIPFLFIRGKIKNKGSRRKVPIHSKLIELGFLRYVESIGSGWIFPDLTTTNEKRSHSWSKWWGRYARRHGIIKNKQKVFHSIRHKAKNKLRNDRTVESELFDAVMGHKVQSESGKYGRDKDGIGYSLKNLRQAIEALSYPQIEDVVLKLF